MKFCNFKLQVNIKSGAYLDNAHERKLQFEPNTGYKTWIFLLIKKAGIYRLNVKPEIFEMREAMFIKKNADKWNKYQHSPTDNPDETAERFVNLIDDLSYAKTFYPKRKATRWINGIAAAIYQSIYQNKKEK